jgi:hypothetical protein
MSVKKQNIPAAEADFIVLARNAANAWKQRQGIILVWTNSQQFETAIGQFENSFTERRTVKGERSIITSELKTLNTEINSNVVYIKNYINELYSKKEATAHYAQFGIIKANKTYGLPRDNDQRLFALRQLSEAVTNTELAGKKYGSAYWQDILIRFDTAKNNAISRDSASAQHIDVKREQKAIIRKTLNSLILSLKANYPDNWREEMRIWGFQKEKY